MNPSADKSAAPGEPDETGGAHSAESSDAESSAGAAAYFVSGRYDYLREIGDGLMGVVFEMLDRETQKTVAARLITHARPREPKHFARLLDSLSRIEHPHLTHFLAHIERDGLHYVLSQFAAGVDLLSYLRQPATIEELAALRKREEIVDVGITDTQEVTQTGPIDLSDPSQELAALDSEPVDVAHSVELTLSEDARSAAEIVGSLVDDSPQAHQAVLDLVLLRLERILPQIVDALAYLHRFKKHHGDLKPGNILVDHTGRCLLTDFGLVQHLAFIRPEEDENNAEIAQNAAKQAAKSENIHEIHEKDVDSSTKDESISASADSDQAPHAPKTTSIKRLSPPTERALADSFAYRAPENLDFDGLPEAGPSADLYALGCVLFEAICGEPPFKGSSAEIREQQLHAEPPAILEIEPYCPASWAELIHGLLAKTPERRATLQDVRELIAYSESYAIDIPASAIPEQDLFFGRGEVIDQILEEVRACYQKKHLGMSVLRGQAGIGKTAIAQAIAYLLSRRGWLVLNGRCFNRESLIYQGWDEIAAQLARIYEGFPAEIRQKLDQCRRQAATLFPILRLAEDPPAEPIARLDAIDSFRSLLRRIASQRPLLLVIDDLHWASWDTSALLLDLLGEPRGLRGMVLGTWQGGLVGGGARRREHPLVRGFQTTLDPVMWIELGGLSTDEAREYVISAGAHLSLPEQQRVLQAGGANPLLLEEFLHMTRHADAETIREILWEEANASDSDQTLTRVVAGRLDALSRRDRFILEILSSASIPLPTALISTILVDEFGQGNPGENEAREALDRLMSLRFIVPIRTHHWDVAYSISHNSYRTVILEQLREQRYAHLCKRIAEGIRRCWPSAQELRFEYLLRAGLNREAADSAIRAAATAQERCAYNRAAKLWRWLDENSAHISLTPGLNPKVEHARLEQLAHRFSEAAELWNAVAEQAAPGVERAGYLRARFDSAMHAGQFSQAVRALDSALENLGEDYLPRHLFWRLEAMNKRAIAAFRQGSPREGEIQTDAVSSEDMLRAQIYRQVLDQDLMLNPQHVARIYTRLRLLAHQTNDALLLGLERYHRARHLARENPRRRARQIAQWLHEARTLFERADAPQRLGACDLFEAAQLSARGKFDEADAKLSAAARYFHHTPPEQFGHRYQLRLGYARLLVDRGELGEARRIIRQVLHHWRGDQLVTLHANLGLVAMELVGGNTDAAADILQKTQQIVGDIPVNRAEIWLARHRAQLNIALGRAEVAVTQLEMLVERAHTGGMSVDIRSMALVYLSLGQALAALAEREKTLVSYRRTDTLGRLYRAVKMLRMRQRALPPGLLAEAIRLHCRLAMLRKRPKRALRLLNAALSTLADYPNPVSWTKNLEVRSHLLKTLDQPEAPALLEQALKTYRRFDARLPLFLEGWPLPEQFSQLSAAQAQKDEL